MGHICSRLGDWFHFKFARWTTSSNYHMLDQQPHLMLSNIEMLLEKAQNENAMKNEPPLENERKSGLSLALNGVASSSFASPSDTTATVVSSKQSQSQSQSQFSALREKWKIPPPPPPPSSSLPSSSSLSCDKNVEIKQMEITAEGLGRLVAKEDGIIEGLEREKGQMIEQILREKKQSTTTPTKYISMMQSYNYLKSQIATHLQLRIRFNDLKIQIQSEAELQKQEENKNIIQRITETLPTLRRIRRNPDSLQSEADESLVTLQEILDERYTDRVTEAETLGSINEEKLESFFQEVELEASKYNIITPPPPSKQQNNNPNPSSSSLPLLLVQSKTISKKNEKTQKKEKESEKTIKEQKEQKEEKKVDISF